jgi:quercetin dioxygenase-like cupin family protein
LIDDVTKDVKSVEPNSYYRTSQLHKKYKIGGITYTIILTGENNDGNYSIIEIEFSSGKEKEIPLHKHTKENIIIYVIEGKFLIQNGNENINAIPGMILKLEKNIEHSYEKLGKDKGKLLVLFEPAGFENYFRDLNALQSSSSSSSISNNLQVFDKDDVRIRLHLLEKNYGWTFSR